MSEEDFHEMLGGSGARHNQSVGAVGLSNGFAWYILYANRVVDESAATPAPEGEYGAQCQMTFFRISKNLGMPRQPFVICLSEGPGT